MDSAQMYAACIYPQICLPTIPIRILYISSLSYLLQSYLSRLRLSIYLIRIYFLTQLYRIADRKGQGRMAALEEHREQPQSNS